MVSRYPPLAGLNVLVANLTRQRATLWLCSPRSSENLECVGDLKMGKSMARRLRSLCFRSRDRTRGRVVYIRCHIHCRHTSRALRRGRCHHHCLRLPSGSSSRCHLMLYRSPYFLANHLAAPNFGNQDQDADTEDHKSRCRTLQIVHRGQFLQARLLVQLRNQDRVQGTGRSVRCCRVQPFHKYLFPVDFRNLGRGEDRCHIARCCRGLAERKDRHYLSEAYNRDQNHTERGKYHHLVRPRLGMTETSFVDCSLGLDGRSRGRTRRCYRAVESGRYLPTAVVVCEFSPWVSVGVGVTSVAGDVLRSPLSSSGAFIMFLIESEMRSA